ncbi:MAG TPA: hypothetical protein VFL57_06945 [Bryobacteraceae bacterium]|nr:hypothetical protein [Bryobacteraceae bacterium]
MRFIPVVLLAAALTVPAFAHDPDDDYYRGSRRDQRSRGIWQRFGGSPVRAAIRDLQAIGSHARVGGHDRDHFYNGIERLRRFDDGLRSGRWDSGAIDKGIEDVKHLSEADQLNPRDRAVLREHLFALRDFRANRGNWSYGGYRDDRLRWPY